MVKEIVGDRYWSGEWQENLPDYDTKVIDGIEITGLIIDDGELFVGSREDETGSFRGGEEEGHTRLHIVAEEEGGDKFNLERDGIMFDAWYGDETDTNRLPMHVFDGDGRHLATYRSDTCGWDTGCETFVGFTYDFEEGEIEGSSWNVEEEAWIDDETFTSDRLLVAYGTSDIAPDTWPQALDKSDFNILEAEGLLESNCSGYTDSISLEVENGRLAGNLDGTISIVNAITGDVVEQDIDIEPEEIVSIEADIQVPTKEQVEDSSEIDFNQEIDMVEIEYNGSVVYTDSTEIVDPTEGISIDSLNFPDTVITGESVSGNSFTVINTGLCGDTIEVQFDGNDVGSEEISSDEELEFTFDYQAPEVFETTTSEYVLSVLSDGDEIDEMTTSTEVLGLPEVINVSELDIEGLGVSGRDVDVTVAVQNDSESSRDVEIHADGSEVAGDSIRSGREREFTFDHTLPEVDETQEASIDIEVHTEEGVVDAVNPTIDVSPEHEFVELTDLRIPSTAESGETIGTRDATAVVESEIGDIFVEIEYDGSVVGSSSISRSGSEEVGIEFDAPEVAGEERVDITIAGEIDDNSIGTATDDMLIQGPAVFIDIDYINSPSQMVSGEVVEITAEIDNTSSSTETVNLVYQDEVVAREDIRSDRSEDFTFEYTGPEVEGSEDVTLDLEAVVDDVVADTGSTTIQVDNISNFIQISDFTKPDIVLEDDVVDLEVTVDNDYSESYDVELEYDGDVVGSDTISADRSSSFTFEFVAPNVDGSEDIPVNLDVIVDGDVVDSTTESVQVDSVANYIDIVGFEQPDIVLSGETVELETTISNNFGETFEVDLEYDGSIVGSTEIRSDRESTISFDFTAPDISGSSRVPVNLIASSRGEIADELDEYVEVDHISEFIEFVDLDKPSNIFSAESGEAKASIANTYNSSVDVELEYEGVIVDSTTIRSGREDTMSFTYDSPDVEEESDETIEPIVLIDDEEVVSRVGTITVEPALLDIESIGVPDSVCAGNSVDVEVEVSNPTNISRDSVVNVSSDRFGSDSFDIDDIGSGSSGSGEVTFDTSVETPEGSEQFDVIVERYGTSAVEVDSGSADVQVNVPDVEIDSIDIPSTANPGEVEGTVTAKNHSPCNAEVDVVISGESNVLDIESGTTSEGEITFTIGTSEETLDIEVVNVDTGEVLDVSSHTIRPTNYANISTSTGDVHIINGYDSALDIEGQVAGQNVEVDADIESEFDVLPNIAGTSFDGQIDGDGEVKRIIRTDDLRFLNVGVSDDITWVVDGAVEGTSRSFRYSAGGIDNFIPEDELRPRRVRTQSKSRVGSNLGTLRTVLGLR